MLTCWCALATRINALPRIEEVQQSWHVSQARLQPSDRDTFDGGQNLHAKFGDLSHDVHGMCFPFGDAAISNERPDTHVLLQYAVILGVPVTAVEVRHTRRLPNHIAEALLRDMLPDAQADTIAAPCMR